MLIRMLADAALVAAAFAVAVGLRLLYLIAFEAQPEEGFTQFVRRDVFAFTKSCPLVILIAIAAFWINGFYTYSVQYLSKYKTLIVFQAVTLAYLCFGFLLYFIMGGDQLIARGALLLGWLLTSAVVIASRVWSDVWKKHVSPERESIAKAKSGEHRVLVIGGGGYIGSALVPQLLDDGYKVRMLDLLLFGEDPIRSFKDHPNLEIIEGDFRNQEPLLCSLRDADSVVHLGAIVGDPACKLDENLTIDVNLLSTRTVAELARSFGVRKFIFASTCSVYGASNETLDERSRTKPISLYGDTKLASERLLLSLSTPDFAPTILRFATIYGLSGRTRFDLVVNVLTAKAKKEGEITVHGGAQWRPFVHVIDAARAIATTLAADPAAVANEVFNVGSNEQNYTISEVAELVANKVPGTKVVVAEDMADNRNYRVSFDKILKRLGFTPKYTVEDGIDQVIDAIDDGEIVDYSDAMYSNVKSLTQAGTESLAKDQWAKQLIQDIARQ